VTTDGKAPIRILGISGSLRRASFNSGLVRAAQSEAPDGVELTLLDRLGEVPVLDDDARAEAMPPEVERVVEQVRAADAVLIATPEYCYGIPGGLKNLIDWLSSPPPTNPLRFKPVALMGASIGHFGTLRAQAALRQVLLYHEAHVLTKPEIYVAGATAKFDADGNLVDDKVRALVRRSVAELREHALAVRARGFTHDREFAFT
jgi:chromate reductase